MRFTVLGSGSAGNASLLEAGGFGLLLDAGLGPRQLSARMSAVGISWKQVHGVILTHTHSDHWNERTLAYLHRRRVPFFCHEAHRGMLARTSREFTRLLTAGLVHLYESIEEFEVAPGLHCLPLPVRHDGGATFGFRFEGAEEDSGAGWSLGYVADLGCWTPELAQALADVDLLALEFNHDVAMEYASGRSRYLIARVLGDDGHLSNEQAAALLCEVVRRSAPGRLRHLVQLHLSRDCNHVRLALAAAEEVLGGLASSVMIHTAFQHEPGPCLTVEATARPSAVNRPHRAPARRAAVAKAPPSYQQWLPGWEA
jgi:ribonuclease BN (tRNA processing enzyme)